MLIIENYYYSQILSNAIDESSKVREFHSTQQLFMYLYFVHCSCMYNIYILLFHLEHYFMYPLYWYIQFVYSANK